MKLKLKKAKTLPVPDVEETLDIKVEERVDTSGLEKKIDRYCVVTSEINQKVADLVAEQTSLKIGIEQELRASGVVFVLAKLGTAQLNDKTERDVSPRELWEYLQKKGQSELFFDLVKVVLGGVDSELGKNAIGKLFGKVDTKKNETFKLTVFKK